MCAALPHALKLRFTSIFRIETKHNAHKAKKIFF